MDNIIIHFPFKLPLLSQLYAVQVLYRYHFSLISFSLEQFLCFSFSFMTLTFFEACSYFVECPTVLV